MSGVTLNLTKAQARQVGMLGAAPAVRDIAVSPVRNSLAVRLSWRAGNATQSAVVAVNGRTQVAP